MYGDVGYGSIVTQLRNFCRYFEKSLITGKAFIQICASFRLNESFSLIFESVLLSLILSINGGAYSITVMTNGKS